MFLSTSQAIISIKDKAASYLGFKSSVPSENLYETRQKCIGSSCKVFFQDAPVQVLHGSGQYLFDENGARYLDCISNVQHVGHAHPAIAKAASKQMNLSTCNVRFLHPSLVQLSEELKGMLPEGLDTFFFTNSGSESNDLALRILQDNTDGRGIVVLDHAYHGHTIATIDISPYKFNGKGGRGKPAHIEIAPTPDVYRGKYRLPEDKSSDQKEELKRLAMEYASEVKSAIERLESRGVKFAGFIMEALQSCGGQIIPPPGYLEEVLRIVHKAGGLVIVDEVQTGFGRVGETFWAFQLQGQDVCPDVVTMGKPMGNGFPVSALVTKKEVADKFGRGMAYFNTFGGNPVSCEVALAVLRVLKEEKLQESAKITGEYLLGGLRRLKEKHGCIGDVRGIGLFAGIELVKNRDTRDPDTELAGAVIKMVKKNYRILLSTDGPNENVIKFKSPLCFSRKNVDELLEALDAVFGLPRDEIIEGTKK